MSAELDKDILANLTDEEREAINGGDTSPEEQAALQEIADADAGFVGEDGGDEDEGEGEDEDAAVVVADAVVAPSAAAVVIDGDAEEAGDDAPAFRSRYKAELPSDYADRVAAIRHETDALANAFKVGDIDFDEFQVRSQDIAERREVLTIQRAKSEIAEEMVGQTEEQEWGNTISRFFAATAKAGGTDYSKDAVKQADLDQFVKALASNPANQYKSGEWYLAEAHKRVNALHGLTAAAPTATNTKRAKQIIPAASLAHVPGGNGPGDLAGEFAGMDGLEGDALETAIARMTSAQREKYSMSA
jgi:hypothetical protein